MELEEATQDSQEDERTKAAKKRKTNTRSGAWERFNAIELSVGEPPRLIKHGKCKQCGKLIKVDPRSNGTSSLNSHLVTCDWKRATTAASAQMTQTQLNLQAGSEAGVGSLTNWKFDAKISRIKLAEMIILDEMPFKTVERIGFRRYSESLNPNFRLPSRQTVREDCVLVFLQRKDNLKSYFQKKGMGRVSLTTDCWTATNTSFICVTAHFIANWVLHKKIISFKKIEGHRGEDIGEAVIDSLKEWELERIFCITMDNASANDSAVNYMKPILERNSSIIDEKFLHMRCVAHIINLVVSSGLEEIGMSVRRVREVVKWMKASPGRHQQFKDTVQLFKDHISSTKGLVLDVPTRWNSTYLMLESAEPYEEVFKWFGSTKKAYKTDLNLKKYKDEPIGPPEEQDWVNVRRTMAHLEKFYYVTLLVSGTKYATSHLFFKEICDVFELILELEMNEDNEVARMAQKMKMKVEKYWMEQDELNPKMNKILYIAAILDPRQKLKHVEMCLKTVYGESRGNQLVRVIRDHFDALFASYKARVVNPTRPSDTSSTSSSSLTSFDIRHQPHFAPKRRGACSRLRQVQPESGDNSEIALYLIENHVFDDIVGADNYNILQWWELNYRRFPVMCEMAKDILAIPISSVASECAFSTGGHVLSPFRSSLTSNMVEALICAEDWLNSSLANEFLDDEEGVPEEELETQFQRVVTIHKAACGDERADG